MRPRSGRWAWTWTPCWPGSPAVRYCLDWSEQRHHLAGPLGTALADRMFALGWVRRTDRRRVVRVTDTGREHLPATLGLPRDWDQPAQLSQPLSA